MLIINQINFIDIADYISLVLHTEHSLNSEQDSWKRHNELSGITQDTLLGNRH